MPKRLPKKHPSHFWRSLLIFVVLLVISGVGTAVAANEQVLQLEVLETSEPSELPCPEGWLGALCNLRHWLGASAKKAKIIRPKVGTKFKVQSSAYASSPYQTDSTPCITAAGTVVREGVVATNFLPLGTLVEVFGKIHIVEDRMASRYAGQYMDIWFPSTSLALEFGRKHNVEIKIVAYGKPGQALTVDKDKAEVPSTLKRAQARFTAFTRTISASLLTKVNPNVNRYDVDCTKKGAGA